MADRPLRPALIALAFAAGGCDVRREAAGPSSVTVPLPPARVAGTTAGFSFQAPPPEPAKHSEH